ncbi:uncharacterized protein LOC62_03G004948 [Vanrija pseudolonga]|uniref:Uncharacterized protein n=1 Tax=Vanrija pseudolonga TaxID=143232 RepID=A0AAF0Y7D5_9TREE|nr:hypothetical protein LOC62_03G004948 [Vanrija pseudolonga]
MPPRRKPRAGAAAAAAAVVVVASSAKKADKQGTKAAPRRSAQRTYPVLYRVRRQHDESTEEHAVGRYVVYADAKAKVRAFLPEWYHELSDGDWQEYAEMEEGELSGGFEVHVVDPEGDDYWVCVEEDVPSSSARVAAASSAPAPAPVQVPVPPPPRHAPETVYAVVARRGRGEKRVDDTVYTSREAADAAADDVPRTPGTAIAVVELTVVYS